MPRALSFCYNIHFQHCGSWSPKKAPGNKPPGIYVDLCGRPHWSWVVTHANTWNTVGICGVRFGCRFWEDWELPLPPFWNTHFCESCYHVGSPATARETMWTEKDQKVIWEGGKDQASQHLNWASWWLQPQPPAGHNHMRISKQSSRGNAQLSPVNPQNHER